MDDALRNNAVTIEYNGLQNETKEIIMDDAIINAILMEGRKPFCGDQLLTVGAFRTYEGQERTEKSEFVSFRFLLLKNELNDQEEYDKVTFIVDGERVVVDAKSYWEDSEDEDDEYWMISDLIKGEARNDIYWESKKEMGNRRTIDASIPVAIVKKIAEAKNVCMYVDSSEMFEVNGGICKFQLVSGSVKIEGLQAFMKRVYHFFVDNTCYTDYCSSFYGKKANATKKREVMKQKEEKEEQEAYEQALSLRNIYLIVLSISLLVFILAICFEWDTFWTIVLPLIAAGFSIFKIGRLYGKW